MSKSILTVWPENDYRLYLSHNDEDMKYGLPGKKKYPMPDRDHVMSAIKFFNYASPSEEKELARNINARIREYGITDINVGKENRFRKYYKPLEISHHGILGMKWGIKNGPPYPLGVEDHNASERKAGWMDSLKNKANALKDNISGKVKDQAKLNEANKIAKKYGYTFSGVTKDYSSASFWKMDKENGYWPTDYNVKTYLKDNYYSKAQSMDSIEKSFKKSEVYRKNCHEYNSIIRDAIANTQAEYIAPNEAKKLSVTTVSVSDNGQAYVYAENRRIKFDASFDMKKKKAYDVNFMYTYSKR